MMLASVIMAIAWRGADGRCPRPLPSPGGRSRHEGHTHDCENQSTRVEVWARWLGMFCKNAGPSGVESASVRSVLIGKCVVAQAVVRIT